TRADNFKGRDLCNSLIFLLVGKIAFIIEAERRRGDAVTNRNRAAVFRNFLQGNGASSRRVRISQAKGVIGAVRENSRRKGGKRNAKGVNGPNQVASRFLRSQPDPNKLRIKRIELRSFIDKDKSSFNVVRIVLIFATDKRIRGSVYWIHHQGRQE